MKRNRLQSRARNAYPILGSKGVSLSPTLYMQRPEHAGTTVLSHMLAVSQDIYNNLQMYAISDFPTLWVMDVQRRPMFVIRHQDW